MFKNVLILIFILGLLYILYPDSNSIDEFSLLPESSKLIESGFPSLATYYSNFDRNEITKFYEKEYRNKSLLGKFIPPIKINHPPQEAYKYIRDLQQSTFLEEYTYPLKSSLFVNGYEPVVDNKINNYGLFDHILVDGKLYISKTTIKLYRVNTFTQIIVYCGIWMSLFGIYKVGKKIRLDYCN